MTDDDLPPQPHKPEETAAGLFGELTGATIWIALFVGVAGVVLYIVMRAHG